LGAPEIPRFWDENGFSARPFIYTAERERSIKTNFRWVTTINKEHRRYVYLFVDGDGSGFLRRTGATAVVIR